jgi:hypothetical protein
MNPPEELNLNYYEPLTLPELKDIPEYENRYKASRDGRIYSVKNKIFLKPGDDTYGYRSITLSGKCHKVHRLIAKTFLENPEQLPHIDHINRDRSDNSVDNLRYVSLSDNQLNRATIQTKDPELKNILVKKSTYKVMIKRKNLLVYKTFKTLSEAKEYRDRVLNESKNAQAQTASPSSDHHQ